jgi:hypothetical protein
VVHRLACRAQQTATHVGMVSYMSAAAHCGQPYHPAAATSNHGTIFVDLVSHIAFWQSLACAGSPYYPWHQTPIQASLWLRVLSTLYFCGLMVLGMLSVWRSWQNPVKAPVKHVCSNAHPYTAPVMLITLTTAGDWCALPLAVLFPSCHRRATMWIQMLHPVSQPPATHMRLGRH